MRDLSILAALASLSGLAASQTINLAYVDAQPDPTYTIASDKAAQTIPYNQESAVDSAANLATASPLPVAASPTPSSAKFRRHLFSKKDWDCGEVPTTPNIYNAVIDPAESFLADDALSQVALQASTPSGYTRTYQNKKASAQANGYMGYSLLDSYDTNVCANKCNQALGCQGFNIYFERSPSIRPAAACPNPPGTANIFCVLWGGPVTEDNCRNDGQWRDQYHVVIAGSNGYVLTSSLSPLSNKAINAPRDCNDNDSYMGMRMFTDNAPFDPERCRAVCEATSQYNIEHNPDPSTPPKLCKFYNTYILSKNYQSLGQTCAMYSEAWDPETYAVNDGQWDGEGNHYTISSSVFFHNATDVVTPVCPADITSLQGNNDAVAFCASYIGAEPPTTTTVTSYTSTTTVQACGGSPTVVKRDASDAAVVEAVVAVYPEKVHANATGPVAITIPAESVTDSAAFASATSEGASSLGAPAITTPVSLAARTAVPAATPSILAGRDSLEISSACSRIASGTALGTATRTVQAVATATNTDSCAQYATVCENGDPAQLVAGGFTTAPFSYDDTSFAVNLPFQVCIYDRCSTRVYMTTNGVVQIDDAGAPFSNVRLPIASNRQQHVYAFWDDLFIFAGRKHYMDFAVCGAAGHRTVTFDWRMGHFGQNADGPLYSFSVTFYEDKPSRVYLRYFGTTDQGISATVGMDGFTGGQASQYMYSFNQARITNGLGLIFDPHANYFGVASSSPSAS